MQCSLYGTCTAVRGVNSSTATSKGDPVQYPVRARVHLRYIKAAQAGMQDRVPGTHTTNSLFAHHTHIQKTGQEFNQVLRLSHTHTHTDAVLAEIPLQQVCQHTSTLKSHCTWLRLCAPDATHHESSQASPSLGFCAACAAPWFRHTGAAGYSCHGMTALRGVCGCDESCSRHPAHTHAHTQCRPLHLPHRPHCCCCCC